MTSLQPEWWEGILHSLTHPLWNLNIFTIDGYDDIKTNRNTLINYGKYTTFENVIDITPVPLELQFCAGSVAGKAGSIGATVEFALASFEYDLTSKEKALKTVAACDEMIEYIGKQLSCVGATMNRLESALDSTSIAKINMAQAKSLITDTDIAKESLNYVKSSICKDISAALFTQSYQINKNYYASLLAS